MSIVVYRLCYVAIDPKDGVVKYCYFFSKKKMKLPLDIPSKNKVCMTVLLHQKEEEAAEGAQEAEGEGGTEDGLARRLHRRYRRLIHVLPQHHQ